jgi:putative redox protein
MIIRYQNGTKFTVEERGHEITVDLPEEKGGTDSGMTPSELLAAAFGSCICLYVTHYLKQVGEDPTGTTVDVHYEMAEKPMRIGHVHAVVNLPETVPEERRPTVERAAASCPIHHTLCSLPDAQVELASSAVLGR